MEREPVEITIEPTHVDILSYAGPDRSISSEAIKETKKLKARRYRNRRLGYPCREDMIRQNDIAPANQVEDFQQKDSRLEQILGQSLVTVQSIVYPYSIINKLQLLQILKQLSVKVWDKSEKTIDKEVLSRLTIEMI